MCTAQCSKFIAFSLYPFVFISILCNIVLFFPAGSVEYAQQGLITEEVKYMGGILGGGIMVLISSIYIHFTGENGCCGNRFGMFISIAFAALGVAGAFYSFIVALIGLKSGPLCYADGEWSTPFKHSNTSYLADSYLWGKCIEPKNVVQFNIGLFLALMATSCLQALLCAAQIINGLAGCMFGACNEKKLDEAPLSS